jgi:cytochrome c oxidase cbb3-type subunit 2
MDDGLPMYPQRSSGVAAQGRKVYIEMGCVSCHTQQVRPESAIIELPQLIKGKTAEAFVTPDIDRGWAERGSVPRDYIFQDQVLLGTQRIGPDLMDVGSIKRGLSASNLYLHLYDPRLIAPDSVMPSFRFLFETKTIAFGDDPSPLALHFPDGYAGAPKAGDEIVPTDRAIALVAYLQSLKLDYELPEAKFAKEFQPAPSATSGPAAGAPAAGTAAAPASSAAKSSAPTSSATTTPAPAALAPRP